MFVMVDFVRGMTVKKFCKRGKYEWFEHLFLFVCLCEVVYVYDPNASFWKFAYILGSSEKGAPRQPTADLNEQDKSDLRKKVRYSVEQRL